MLVQSSARAPRPAAPHRPRRKQRGITLLESLVSILILAIGVLGLLGVQLRTLAENQTGVRRAQAVRLIEDLGERMKANPGRFAQLNSYVSDWTDTGSGTPTAACESATCTPAQLAAFDVQRWKQTIAETLPGGQASVFTSPDEAGDVANRRQLGVMVGWRANERKREGESVADSAQYTAPFKVSTSAAAAVDCPAGLICHLVYVQP